MSAMCAVRFMDGRPVNEMMQMLVLDCFGSFGIV